MKACRKFKFRDRDFELGDKTHIVGILNVTPDSFSDGSLYLSPEKAVKHAIEMLDNGADIIDIGGESTRPGSKPVSTDEEISRVVPVIAELRKKRPLSVISVDTCKSEVAEEALKAGTDIINDIGGLRDSRKMAEVAAKSGAGLILMHMRGTPETMQSLTEYGNLISDIISSLENSIKMAESAGIEGDHIVIDPGIGFAKTTGQNLEILKNMDKFVELGYPLLLGPSRKSFIGTVLDRKEPAERIFGTAGVVAWLAMKSVDFVRVHDVREMSDVLKIIESIKH